MKEIQLTQGYVALVDDDDYERVSRLKWCASIRRKNGKISVYAITNVNKRGLLMQHFIIGKPEKGLQTDHINRNSLDNRKVNLRKCTSAENNCNVEKRTSGNKYKGVYWYDERKMFRANINVNKKYIFLGYYKNELDAAIAYNNAALKYHGDFACLNKL